MTDTTSKTEPRQRRLRRVIPTLVERYGISRQAAWRCMSDPNVGLPATRFIAGASYIDLDDLDAFDDSRPLVTPAPGDSGEAA